MNRLRSTVSPSTSPRISGGGGPPTRLIGPPRTPEGGERKEIAPAARALERADVDDAENAWQDQRVAQGGEAGELAAEQVAQPGAEDVGERDAPHHRVGDVEVLGEHLRPGHQALD